MFAPVRLAARSALSLLGHRGRTAPATPPREAEPPVPLYFPPALSDPLPPLPPGPVDAQLRFLAEDSHFRRLCRELVDWPADSTVGSSERAVLHWLITAHNMRNVLEIGTYFAGTTHLLAASMQAKGSGHTFTIDPYGAERAPRQLQKWHPALGCRVTFAPRYASEYLVMLNVLPPFEMVFVDGNHTYPNALHDLVAGADNLTPDGYLVVDNVEQPDVLDAVRDFVRLNPHYEAALMWQKGTLPLTGGLFGPEPPGACFAVVKVDRAALRSGKTMTFWAFNPPGLTVGDLSLTYRADRPVRGSVEVILHHRGFPQDNTVNPDVLDLFERHELPVGGRDRGEFLVRSGLALPDRAADYRKCLEISVRLRAGEGERLDGVGLALNGRPLHPGRNFLAPAG